MASWPVKVYKGIVKLQANGPVRKKCSVIVPFEGEGMLVPVEYKGLSKWVRVPKTDEVFDYPQFLQGGNLNVMFVYVSMGYTVCVCRTSNCVMTPIEVIFFVSVLAKFNLPGFTTLILKDSAGVEVDSDIFDELLKSSDMSLKAFTEVCNG